MRLLRGCGELDTVAMSVACSSLLNIQFAVREQCNAAVGYQRYVGDSRSCFSSAIRNDRVLLEVESISTRFSDGEV